MRREVAEAKRMNDSGHDGRRCRVNAGFDGLNLRGLRTLVLRGLLVLGAASAATARADGLRIANVKLTPRDAATATVQFDITWENSWYHGIFHDAAWVFFKVRADAPSEAGKSEWQHVRLAADKVLNPAGYSSGNGTPLAFVVPDGDDGFVGMFVRRATDGVGDVSAQGVTAVISLKPETRNLLARRSPEGEGGKPEVRAFGVEMIYVAEGPFYLGKGNETPAQFAGLGFGGMELNWFYKVGRRNGQDYTSTFPYTKSWRHVHWAVGYTSDNLRPYKVKSADAIPTGNQKGKLWAVGYKPEDEGEIPAAFPNGYNAFYFMKNCWFTAGQYADFLNTLTEDQAKPRYYTGGHGTAIKRSGASPNYTYSALDPEGRCPWMSWMDGATYAAWAGLRPMTELEYEKASRGTKIPVPNDADNMFWGMMGQGTRMYEREISVADATGRAFKGTHGRGTTELPADWPAQPADFKMTGRIPGTIYRGDYFMYSGYIPGYLLTGGRTGTILARSDRSANPYPGWRAARSAPAPGDTGMSPLDRLPDSTRVTLARMKQPMQPDGVLDEWGEPTVVINSAATIYPTYFRSPSLHTADPWRGAADMSIKAYLGWDGESLCIAAEVTDDRQFNTQSGETLYGGDAMQVGLVDRDGTQWNLGLALTEENGVQFHQWAGKDDTLQKAARYAVVRDDEERVTRYELRLPLANLGLTAGAELSYYLIFFDDDLGNGSRYRLQWAPTVTDPFKRDLYPRVVLAE